MAQPAGPTWSRQEYPGGCAHKTSGSYAPGWGDGAFLPFFLPSQFQPHILVPLTRIPVPIPLPAATRDGAGGRFRGPFCGSPRAGEARPVPARGRRQRQQQGGIRDQVDAREGTGARPRNGARLAAPAKAFPKSSGTAPPRRANPGRSPPARGLGERCQGPGKSFRQCLGYQE